MGPAAMADSGNTRPVAPARWIGFIALVAVVNACGGDRGQDDSHPADPLAVTMLPESSERYIARIGDAVGHAHEARYLDGARHVVVLDRYSPHLRLFTADGDPVWAGGLEGDGPQELRRPLTIATHGDTVLAFQRGRVSEWRFTGEALVFERAVPLPPAFVPLGAVTGCDEHWLFYARNETGLGEDADPFQPVRVTEMDFLHTLDLSGEEPQIEVLWADQDPMPSASEGHAAALMGRTGERVAVLHRPHYWGAGRILEFTCDGTLIHSHSERALIFGDSLPVLVPKTQPLQWTAGIAALHDGVLLPLHRFLSPRFYDVDEWEYRTEFFRFTDGEYQGSFVVNGQWSIMDHDSAAGVLLGQSHPFPHFVRLPAAAFEPTGGSGDW